jgi:predicted DNA-binding protein YlxM (UPF0122 family)
MQKNYSKYKPTKTHVRIIKAWSKVELKHPSFQEIADKAGCSKSLVSQIITRLERGLIEGYNENDL